MKALVLYAAMIAAAAGMQHALVKLAHDADAPVRAIAQAQSRQPFGYQIPPAQLSAIQANYASATATDVAALAQAERTTP